VGDNFSWRYAFWGEAFCMLPFAVLAFAMNPLQLKGFAPVESRKFLEPNETTSPLIEGSDDSNIKSCVIVSSDKASRSSPASKSLNQLSRFSKDMKELLRDKVYVVNILGYVSYNFVIGAYSYWGPKAGYSIYRMSNPDLLFGGITIVCGILGTLAGGLILDSVNATINNAFKLLSGATILGAIFCFSAFCVRSLYFFVVLFSMGELLVFATQAPVNYVSLRCVKPSLRPLSMAVSTVSIHIFGDVPSSPLAGILQDHVNNWRVTTLVVTSVLFFASGIWFIGIFISNSDKFNEDGKEEVSTVDRATKKPLFEENTIEGAQDSGEA
ncbi:probable sphingolipid transporter spinster homolog 3, partial [Prunus avium]|uniref:Probable sphingolipid transporter spinster homolog 3 n=1 Tax=Prunus avium TaxID=42229 RepID=A0A6P5RC79_PRUAV